MRERGKLPRLISAVVFILFGVVTGVSVQLNWLSASKGVDAMSGTAVLLRVIISGYVFVFGIWSGATRNQETRYNNSIEGFRCIDEVADDKSCSYEMQLYTLYQAESTHAGRIIQPPICR